MITTSRTERSAQALNGPGAARDVDHTARPPGDALSEAVKCHWPEYLMEAAGLGTFVVSASVFAVLLFHPASPAARLPALAGRALMGLAMGLTAIGLIYSPWGKQSGAHFNPAVTLTFARLGRVAAWDAAFYMAAQFAGGVAGMGLVALTAGSLAGAPGVDYVVTVPGAHGVAVAFAAEVVMAFATMSMVLLTTARVPRLAPFTGIFAGVLVAVYITVEAPLSGMSLNPARTFASALVARLWTALWVYMTAPALGMLLAAEVHGLSSAAGVPCAKLHHANDRRCIFRCRYARAIPRPASACTGTRSASRWSGAARTTGSSRSG